MTDLKPTLECYDELQRAYDFFNKALFEARLPACIITLTRKKNTLGYFSPERFVNQQGVKVDEIAMNASVFPILSIERVLSTLVHEMAHQQIHHFGQKSRRGYHSAEWAELMVALGLMPSETGEPGGKKTGQRMSHFVMDGEAFSLACSQLLTEEFTLSWMDRFPPSWCLNRIKDDAQIEAQIKEAHRRAELKAQGLDPDEEGEEGPGEPQEPDNAQNLETKLDALRKIGVVVDIEDPPTSKKKTDGSNRLKYTCPCGHNIWGKPELKVLCAECESPFEPKSY